MLLYIVFIFFLIVVNVKYLGKENKYAAYFLMFLIVLIICFRDKTVGVDTIDYVNYFLKPYLGYGNDTREFEYLFQKWCELIKQIWPNGNFFIFSTSLAALLPVFYTINKVATNKIIGISLFVVTVWVFYFYLLRQCLAIGLFCIGVYALYKKQYIKAIIFFVLATFFHTTVLLCVLLLLAIYFIEIKKETAIILILLSFIIALSGIFKVDEILFYGFSLFTGVEFIDRYQGYADQTTEFTSLYLVLKSILPLSLLCTILVYNLKDDTILKNLFVKLFIAYIVVSNLMLYSLYTFRILLYLQVMNGIGLSIFLTNQSSKKVWKLYLFILIALSWITIMNISNTDHLVNYKFFF